MPSQPASPILDTRSYCSTHVRADRSECWPALCQAAPIHITGSPLYFKQLASTQLSSRFETSVRKAQTSRRSPRADAGVCRLPPSATLCTPPAARVLEVAGETRLFQEQAKPCHTWSDCRHVIVLGAVLQAADGGTEASNQEPDPESQQQSKAAVRLILGISVIFMPQEVAVPLRQNGVL